MHRYIIPQCFFSIIILDAIICCYETAALGLQAWEVLVSQLSPPQERQGVWSVAVSKVRKQQWWDCTTTAWGEGPVQQQRKPSAMQRSDITVQMMGNVLAVCVRHRYLASAEFGKIVLVFFSHCAL